MLIYLLISIAGRQYKLQQKLIFYVTFVTIGKETEYKALIKRNIHNIINCDTCNILEMKRIYHYTYKHKKEWI